MRACAVKSAVKALTPRSDSPGKPVDAEADAVRAEVARQLPPVLLPLVNPPLDSGDDVSRDEEEGEGKGSEGGEGELVRYTAAAGLLRLVRGFWVELGEDVYTQVALAL